MPTVLVAPDKFAHACTAFEAAQAIADGLRSVRSDVRVVIRPIADGGEGTADVLEPIARRVRTLRVPDPRGVPRPARLLDLDAVRFVETADANGIRHVRDRLDPWRASTEGVGQLVDAARTGSAHRPLALGLGGSATVDGGVGLLHALGATLHDRDGAPVPPTARALPRLHRVDLHRAKARLAGSPIHLWSDVAAPLLSAHAAVTGRSFLRQKGVDGPGELRIEHGWRRLVAAIQRGGHPADPQAPGSGAAGGLGFALLTLGAQLRSGADAVLEAVGFEQALAHADLVITGEGAFDDQSLAGKGPGEVIRRADAAGRRVVVIAGRVDSHAPGLTTHALTPTGEPLSTALPATLSRLRDAGATLAHTLP